MRFIWMLAAEIQNSIFSMSVPLLQVYYSNEDICLHSCIKKDQNYSCH